MVGQDTADLRRTHGGVGVEPGQALRPHALDLRELSVCDRMVGTDEDEVRCMARLDRCRRHGREGARQSGAAAPERAPRQLLRYCDKLR